METEERIKIRIIRDKAFAKRLEIACEGNPHCPTDQYRGKQKWVYDGLESEFGVKVSSEAVRKWFAGESRPRPKIMSFLARLLEVDEGWLSLGIKPDLTPVEKKRRTATADGAVNLFAGIIQMNGGHIAFPDDDSAHIFAIIGGKQLAIDVAMPFSLGNDRYRIVVSDNLDRKRIVVIFEEERFGYQVVVLTPEQVRDAGDHRGDFYEVVIEQRGIKFKAGNHQVREITDIRELLLDAAQPPPA